MKIFKFFQYAYLVFAVLFIYVAGQKYMETEIIDYMSLLLAATAVFMFFFRKKFNKRFDDRDRK
ncbi:hypothetical protein BZARG_03450 [Bizionia argentinensis JUB59]|uniref:Uncharacterized protein n=1 Tax=Bizionia argentinensis JUB59 TaxID=1046627 RepID=A0A4U8UGR0_9FLAO|nr:hypothetical protein [Bizionia argentinensis]TLG99019.1 hypothetical protein BZARG_03450 [Bizionia argentinensis JUB59]